MKLQICLLLVFTCTISTKPSFALTEPTIRVAVSEPSNQIVISGSSLKISPAAKKGLPNKEHKLIFAASKTGIKVNNVLYKHKKLVITSRKLIKIDGRSYRNAVEIILTKENGKYLLLPVHELPLETYLVGTVSSEVPKSWPLEALKAQAVASRTYALWQKSKRSKEHYHLKSSVLDQVYEGVQNNHLRARKAVRTTKGQALFYKKKLAQVFFHADCGGRTENAKEIWGTEIRYLPSVRCKYCRASPKHRWKYTISKASLHQKLHGIFPEKIKKIKITKKTRSGRAKTVKLYGKKKSKSVSGKALRAAIGYSNLRSTKLTRISVGARKITFKGLGYGHGSGMCQWGAMGMAKKGYSAKRVLAKYYPGTKIKKAY